MAASHHNGRAGKPNIAHRVHEILQRNLNTDVLVRDISTETGLTKEQILGALQGLRTRRRLDIVTIFPGHSYRYTGALRTNDAELPATPQEQAKRLFEEIGTSRDGTVIIQDGDGALYRASEL